MISVQNLPFVGEWYRYCNIGIRSASATWMDVNSNCTSRFHWGSSWPAQLPHCQLITEDTHDKCRSTWLITQCMLYLVSYAHPVHISSSHSILIMLAIITMLHHFFFFCYYTAHYSQLQNIKWRDCSQRQLVHLWRLASLWAGRIVCQAYYSLLRCFTHDKHNCRYLSQNTSSKCASFGY